MKYEEAMRYITEVGNFGSNYGLERTERLLELLGNPHKDLKLIHVAGTNGKGSTTSMITEILMGAGYKVGMYTSPFIEEFEERIQINRNNIPKDMLALLMEKVKIAVDKVIDEGYNHPTEFEIITVLMFLYFKEEKIDFGVVEVGLGGTLDSTNVLNGIVQVITSISFDHTNLLGNTLREIATEKSGIIKEGVPTVVYPQEKEVMEVLIAKCSKMNSEIMVVDLKEGQLCDIINEDKIYQRVNISRKNQYTIDLPLLGLHQINNLLVVLKVIDLLNKKNYTNISQEIITNSIKGVAWKGRMEVLSQNPIIVIDGAHNIQGIAALKDNLKKYFSYNKLYLILGILADKDVENMINNIAPMAQEIYAVTPNSIRAELAEDLCTEVKKVNVNCISYNNYEDAYKKALNKANENDIIVITGSLYMIGDMRKIIIKNQ